MKIAMLDTCVVYDLRDHEREAQKRLAAFTGYVKAISYLVYIEVMAAAPLHRKVPTERLLRKFAVLPFDDTAQRVGRQYARQYFTGKENWQVDVLIAAHAKALGLPFVTNNAKDFIFQDLRLYDYKNAVWLR